VEQILDVVALFANFNHSRVEDQRPIPKIIGQSSSFVNDDEQGELMTANENGGLGQLRRL